MHPSSSGNWQLLAGAKLRNSIRIHREILLRCLYEAEDSADTTAAENLFSRKIDTWIEHLHLYAKKAPGINSIQKKAAELLVKHRSRNLTYKAALKTSVLTLRWRSQLHSEEPGTLCFKVYYTDTEIVSMLIVEFKVLSLKYHACESLNLIVLN
jgi:hypothetical protein